MYTLYGKTGSGSASVEAALTLARAPFRIVETASWAQNDAFADLLGLTPLGQVPTLVLDDGSALSESAAILMHLGSAHPDA
jgi:GST-like protein